MKKSKKQFRKNDYIFGLVVVSLFLIMGLAFVLRVVKPAPASWEKTSARVVWVGTGGSCRGGGSIPIGVEYTAVTDVIVSAEGRSTMCPALLNEGDTISIAYNPNKPKEFKMIRYWPELVIPVGIVVVSLLAIGMYSKKLVRKDYK